ncbi:hypothetical protein [Hymenobacter antarcticus]|uniref:DUF4129 domain-containing protein n=1 Tax=Hymenobacter antarcticus TaxID=486270 RepID=A0ABP7QP85_9BACT
MSDNSTDFYHQKTDDELLFFVEHPEYYQPSLIDAARRELRRRGVAQSAPVIHPENVLPVNHMEAPGAGSRTGPLTLLLAALLLVGVGVYYLLNQRSEAAREQLRERAATARKPPPRLIEVATSVIPNYDVPAIVARQLARVPAAERAAATRAGQPMHQYKELAKRFWTAETQTEYVLDQARQNKLTTALPGHVESTMSTWGQWNKALVYSYKFSPAMANHLDLMTRVANEQQAALNDLLLVANNPQAYENDKTRKRAADVGDMLLGILPKSPVTGRPYTAVVRRVRL